MRCDCILTLGEESMNIFKGRILPTLIALAADFMHTSSAYAAGGYVVNDATIANIANTNGNTPAFVVTVAGGSGPCAGTNITFTQSAATDADTFKRAYAAALLAFTTGSTVSIYNYTDTSCTNAVYIIVSH